MTSPLLKKGSAANGIVFDPPCLDFAPSIVEAQEPAFGKRIVCGLARARVDDAVLPGPEIGTARYKSAAIVDPERFGRSAELPLALVGPM